MKKYIAYLAIGFVALCLVGCNKKRTKFNDDFKVQMGKKTDLWKHIVTDEDFTYLNLYEKNYNKNKHLRKRKTSQINIPQTIHFIWLGPKEFPKESKKNVASWIEHHPRYRVKFWTDRKKAPPHPKMEVEYFDNYPFKNLKEQYYLSNNYAERSDILRYEILYNEGGLYVDHDVICYGEIDNLLKNYDLFCGLEPPHAPIISSSVSICNNIIGSIPRHPFLKETISNVKDRWDRIERSFPGTDQESTKYRVAHRTFSSFDEAIHNNIYHSSLKNIVLPAGFFNKIGKGTGIYAHHYYIGSWYKNEDPFENLVRKQLNKMAKKSNKMLLFGAISIILNLVLVSWLIFQYRTIKPAGEK